MLKTVLIIPCYNEAQRLRVDSFVAFARDHDVQLLFVDDGSTDDTSQVLAQVCDVAPGRAFWFKLPENRGKAEAVRAGMLRALAGGADFIGYFDADLATPLEESLRLRELLQETGRAVAIASRVKMLGYDIQRNPARHYLGRIFATMASLTLDLPIYDTQCGAKLFRRTPALEQALRDPFRAKWAFDVEFLGRLQHAPADQQPLTVDALVEMPVRSWRDVAGSKVSLRSTARMGVDLARIWWELRKRRAER